MNHLPAEQTGKGRRSTPYWYSFSLFVPRSFFGLFPLKQPVFEIHNRLSIPFKAQSGKGLDTGHPRIGDLAKALPAADIGQMHFHRRDRDRFQRVQNRDTRVGVGRRIDDDSVRIPVRRLNPVNDDGIVSTAPSNPTDAVSTKLYPSAS